MRNFSLLGPKLSRQKAQQHRLHRKFGATHNKDTLRQLCTDAAKQKPAEVVPIDITPDWMKRRWT